MSINWKYVRNLDIGGGLSFPGVSRMPHISRMSTFHRSPALLGCRKLSQLCVQSTREH